MEAQAGALAMSLCRPAPAQGARGPALPLASNYSTFSSFRGESILYSFVHSFTATHLSTYSVSDWILLEEKMQPQPWRASWEGERKQAQLMKINKEMCTDLDERYWKPRRHTSVWQVSQNEDLVFLLWVKGALSYFWMMEASPLPLS